jgi:hypothetical protein
MTQPSPIKPNRKVVCTCSAWQRIQEHGVIPSLRVMLGPQWSRRGACPHCKASLHTLALYRRVCQMYGMLTSNRSERSLAKEVGALHKMSEDGTLLKYLKYKTAYQFAWGMDQKVPKYPGYGTESAHLAGGCYYAFMDRMRQKSKSHCDTDLRRKSWSFFYSLLMMKKGLIRPGKKALAEAVKEAYETMTRPDERPFSRTLAIEAVMEKARKVVRKLFKVGCMDWSRVEAMWPSVSAHYGNGRKLMGALGAIAGDGFDIGADEGHWLQNAHLVKEMERAINYEEDTNEEIWDDPRHRWVITADSNSKLVELQERWLKRAQEEIPKAEPQALPEALKIRIVTKGPIYTYAALRPVQKMLFKALKKDERFMIGEPMTNTKVRNVLGLLHAENKWLSGDYKAATDNLAIELSHGIAEEIASATAMPMVYRDLLQRALTGHEYWKPALRTKEGDPVAQYDAEGKPRFDEFRYGYQARGQLMGSPVSFPILCIANFALIWDSVFPDYEFEDVQCIVNGDDCLFQCDDEQREQWERAAEDVGLTPSVGKTYFSENFYVINSVMFENESIDAYDDWVCDYTVPYLNFGLILGIKRAGVDRKDDGEIKVKSESIGARYWDMQKEWSAEDYEDDWKGPILKEMIQEFLAVNELPKGVPVHLYEEWGGLGLGGQWSEDEELLYSYLVQRNEVVEAPRMEGEAVQFYTNASETLAKQCGYCDVEVFKVGKWQWGYMGDHFKYQPDNLESIQEVWKELTEKARKQERIYRPVYIMEDGSRLRKKLLPKKQTPAVTLNDTTSPGRVVSAWRRYNNLWEAEWTVTGPATEVRRPERVDVGPVRAINDVRLLEGHTLHIDAMIMV